jgi:hypothetical protein
MKGRADVSDGALLASGERVYRVFAPPWWHVTRWAWWWWAVAVRPLLARVVRLVRRSPARAARAVGRVTVRVGRGPDIEVRVVETEERVMVPEPRRKVARQSHYRRRGQR